ncbi:hypothetical protein M2323_000927 [Rhodoblastus acidophilus]|uniref:hypothetical protein n=1 Tax=Rhodoblastus acidophilus TaxID=1074 RepID=UPI002225551D|nr:hypothetical protein [Rhodoblastus acidophilus]MCW2283157.1 hypothetical protein [Rhodoblastus acidophilus]MCW2332018.1 hypothetical protein [Rhodoblastus acidophilus]
MNRAKVELPKLPLNVSAYIEAQEGAIASLREINYLESHGRDAVGDADALRKIIVGHRTRLDSLRAVEIATERQIETVLRFVNGRAKRHAVTNAQQIAAIAKQINAHMNQANFYLRERAGAEATYRSGGAMEKNQSREITRLVFRVGTNGRALSLIYAAKEQTSAMDIQTLSIALKPAAHASWLARVGRKYGVLLRKSPALDLTIAEEQKKQMAFEFV